MIERIAGEGHEVDLSHPFAHDPHEPLRAVVR